MDKRESTKNKGRVIKCMTVATPGTSPGALIQIFNQRILAPPVLFSAFLADDMSIFVPFSVTPACVGLIEDNDDQHMLIGTTEYKERAYDVYATYDCAEQKIISAELVPKGQESSYRPP